MLWDDAVEEVGADGHPSKRAGAHEALRADKLERGDALGGLVQRWVVGVASRRRTVTEVRTSKVTKKAASARRTGVAVRRRRCDGRG